MVKGFQLALVYMGSFDKTIQYSYVVPSNIYETTHKLFIQLLFEAGKM